MKLHNLQKSGKYKFYIPLLLLVAILMIGFAVFYNDEYSITYGVIGGVALIFYIILLFKKPNFFGIETKYNVVIIRFYNTHLGFSKPRSYQIKNKDLHGYQISEQLGGYSKTITFMVKKGGKIGSYPPVSISLLKQSEIKELKSELDTIIKTNNL